jgi:tRNA 2-thiouridine synthesizing protein A
MAVKVIDARGLKCPQPQLKMSLESHNLQKGDILECIADCPTFEADVKGWCDRTRKSLIMVRAEGTAKRCQVRI